MSPLAYAIAAILSLPSGHLVSHIRDRGGLEHVERLAQMTEDMAAMHHVDPYILAALSFHESSFDSSRIGAAGELGVTQLHPRYLGLKYRIWCWRRVDDRCDLLALDLGAEALRHGLKVCGDYWQALSWYRTGQCRRGPAARRVLVTARHLRWLGKRA